jgi:hypothetical protein
MYNADEVEYLHNNHTCITLSLVHIIAIPRETALELDCQ